MSDKPYAPEQEVLPPEIFSSEQQEIADRVTRMARLLDAQFGIPGTNVRLGLDGILGLVPVIGDALAMLLAGYIFSEALQAKVRKRTLVAMGINTLLDTAIGAVPVLGDIFDISYKSNLRNARLILRDMQRRLPPE